MQSTDYQSLTLQELRKQWSVAWGIEPHARIGRTMLEKSLLFKNHQIDPDTQKRIDTLVNNYNRKPKAFHSRTQLKPGVRLSRIWKGKEYNVLVKIEGFDYDGQHYSSLTKIASTITGSKWNGYVFFGLKD